MEKKTEILNDTKATPEILASEIEAVAKAARTLLAGRLTRRAILVLIKDNIRGNIGLGDIGAVLDSAASLDAAFLKKMPKSI